jgi:hypothetical protein
MTLDRFIDIMNISAAILQVTIQLVQTFQAVIPE